MLPTLLGITAALAFQALACSATDGTDSTGDAYPPEWEMVGADAPSGDLPDGPETLPELPKGRGRGANHGCAHLGAAESEPPLMAARSTAHLLRRRRLLLRKFLNNASILTAAHCLPQPNTPDPSGCGCRLEQTGALSSASSGLVLLALALGYRRRSRPSV